MVFFRKQNAALLIAAILLLCGCNEKKISSINPKMNFDFTYKSKRLSLSSGKPFMLFFLSRSCGVCSEQIKLLNKLSGVLQIAIINDAKDEADAKAVIKAKNLHLPLVYKKSEVYFLSQAVGGVSGVPAIYFYNASGDMVAKSLGLTPLGWLQQTIKLKL